MIFETERKNGSLRVQIDYPTRETRNYYARYERRKPRVIYYYFIYIYTYIRRNNENCKNRREQRCSADGVDFWIFPVRV